ncbi:o-succinylbenzoate synthase [Fluviicola taffensis]|uniref:Mandelate racemase/muconate lactonizing protein n=1 Tax=Fluviicola taffensis (strain DSM 16823 / NCIMB 13979 / RW262) TaxID=755732 RepID=F2IBY1_FLUTR|nr:o-succinylbenzoate synthase [Fluviicola taffensis]AEA42209.1 Mandelate racemase/muconate lactonizing protein [Fluviicola taffensis DSM 16823]
MGSLNQLKASFEAFTLDFKLPSGTSRGVLTQKQGWKLKLANSEGIIGLGECSVIPGLSPDYSSDKEYEFKLTEICQNPTHFIENRELLAGYPSILFGLESAYFDLKNEGKRIYFDSAKNPSGFNIPINGLIWMGEVSYMQDQIAEKLAAGFSCIKLKVGAIDFKQELRVLEGIRTRYDASQIVLRVDANGAFTLEDALWKLEELAKLDLHSIEQPIKAGSWNEMKSLCKKTPLPIALDEELIGINQIERKIDLLETIKPQFIILKPSLHGGFSGTSEWIELAEARRIPWWITSALESNIGLNAIAQFTATYNPNLPQGLGTGGLYETNFEAPLKIEKGNLYYLK